MNDEEYEFSGKTVEEALQKAERDLGLGRDEFETEVISEGRGGILGIGGEDAVIRVRVFDADEAGVALPGNSISVTATAGVEVLSRLLDHFFVHRGIEHETDRGAALALSVRF